MSLKGKLEKLTWAKVREWVVKVNPSLAAIIDKIGPDKNHWLAKVSYPYGAHVMKRATLMLPNEKGEIVPIGDSTLSATINEELSYNHSSNPVSLVLNNCFEIFLPLAERLVPLSGAIQPGKVFGSGIVLNKQTSEQPIFIWDMTAGARSVFMLPKITEKDKHKHLQRQFGLNLPVPKNLMQHWDIFRELVNTSEVTALAGSSWEAEILFFPRAWFHHTNDDKWAPFYQFLYQANLASAEYWRNKIFWDLVISLTIEKYEARPNSYIIDTAKYLLYMGVGSLPGLSPIGNTELGPFDIIQTIYQDFYKIKDYPPIIMGPNFFNFKNPDQTPVYYSLQFPNAMELKPSTRKKVSVISDLHEIRSLMNRFKRDFLSNNLNITGTSFLSLFSKVDYSYFHSGVQLHKGMQNTKEMAKDISFLTTLDGKVHQSFPYACLFGKGCVKVSLKK